MKDKMILKHEKLVYLAIKKLGLYSRLEDFYDVGMIGLIKGVNHYNKSLGYSESTYLYRCIRNEILMTIRNSNSGKRIPDYKLISLSTKVEDEITLEDIIKDESNIEDDLIKKEQIQFLYKEISKLSPTEQKVLILNFGLNEYSQLPQTEIAEILNLSQGQISRIKKNAIRKLRKAYDEKI